MDEIQQLWTVTEELSKELKKLDAELKTVLEQMPKVDEANKRITWIYQQLSDKGILPKKVTKVGELQDKINKLINKEVGIYAPQVSTGMETKPEQANKSAVADSSVN